MVALFLTTTITCSQAFGLLNRIQSHSGLADHIKTELIQVIRESIPTCPVKIKKNER